MDPPFDASIITDLLLHVIGTNLAICCAILLAFRLHLHQIFITIVAFTPLIPNFPVDNPVEIVYTE